MKYEISKYDKHYFLYAKGWYKKTDLWEDLKIIQGNYCNIEPNYITKNDIIQKLLTIAVDIMSMNNKYLKRHVISFINSCNTSEYWKVDAKNYNEAVVKNSLSLMKFTKVINIHPIEDCDYSLLPKHEED